MYYLVTIKPHHAGFNLYDAIIHDEGWSDADELLIWARDGAEWYELGVDELPPEIDDIRGQIYNEPDRVFAMFDDEDQPVYVGIDEAEDTSEAAC